MTGTVTFVGLDLHAHSTHAAAVDVMTGELIRVRFGEGLMASVSWLGSQPGRPARHEPGGIVVAKGQGFRCRRCCPAKQPPWVRRSDRRRPQIRAAAGAIEARTLRGTGRLAATKTTVSEAPTGSRDLSSAATLIVRLLTGEKVTRGASGRFRLRSRWASRTPGAPGTPRTGCRADWLEHLLAREAEFRLPRTVGVDDFPIALGDVLWVKRGAGDDLSGDRQGRHPDTVWLQVCLEHGRG